MDANKLLRRIKKRLGIFYFKLPIPDEDLIETIRDNTLVTFSTYFPFNITLPIDLSDENKVPGEKFGYYINTAVLEDGMEITGIEDVNYESFGMDFGDMYRYGSVTDYMMIQTGLNLQDTMNIPIIPEFKGKNIVTFDEDIRPFYSKYFVSCNTTHSPSFSTIPAAYEDEFFKMAIIDIKIFLYNNLKHFDNIDTTFGNISLKLDEWQNSTDERENLESQWADKYIYAKQKKIYNA